jgi:hypothetical protein
MAALTETKQLVANQNSILGLFKARQIQQSELSKGLCPCGYRFVSTDPNHNIQITGQQVQDRATTGVTSAELYVDWIFANENAIVGLFKAIAMARLLKGKGSDYYHRFIVTTLTPTSVNILFATNDLINL